MTFTGMPAEFFLIPFLIEFFLIPFLIGVLLCGISGVAAAIYLICCVLDWIINRVVIRYYVYSDFLKLVRTSAIKRRKKHE